MSTIQLQLQQNLVNARQAIPKLTKPLIKPLIKLAVEAIEGASLSYKDFEQVEARVGACEQLPELYAIVLTVMQLYYRVPKGSIKSEEFQECLYELRFRIECIDVLKTVLFGPHSDDLALRCLTAPGCVPEASSILWKIDISLAHSSVARLVQPTIIFHITLSTGEVKTFKASLATFHKLRHSVATILKEMRALQNRNVLKHF